MNLPTRQWCLLRRLPSIFYIICSQYTDWRSVKKARSSLEFFNFSPKAFNWPSAVSSCLHHQKKQMTVPKTFLKGLFSPYLPFWTKTLGRACTTHLKICDKKNFRYDVTLDCKTVGFFLTISKEIDKARRKSLTRAKRARGRVRREKKNWLSVFHTMCSFQPGGSNMSSSCQKSVRNSAFLVNLIH